MKFTKYCGEYTLNLDCITNSKLGKVVGDLFPSGNMLSLISYTGCPFDGMHHRLRVTGNYQDLIAWLELLEDKAKNKKYKGSEAANEIRKIIKEIINYDAN